jgi:hypothetical protein
MKTNDDMVNHPGREEWMAYLYGEVKAAERSRLKTHLHDCPACQANLEAWQAARKSLNDWQLPARAQRTAPAGWTFPMFKWAAAAIVFLCAGFVVGRITSASAKVEAVRAAIEPRLRLEFEVQRAEDNRALYSALEKIAARHEADYVALKRDLDTVAVNTDAGLRRAELQLVQLADGSQPATFSSPSQK